MAAATIETCVDQASKKTTDQMSKLRDSPNQKLQKNEESLAKIENRQAEHERKLDHASEKLAEETAEIPEMVKKMLC